MAKRPSKEIAVDYGEKAAVMYTDGSAIPNPGDGGWGFYGYTYAKTHPLEAGDDNNGLIEFVSREHNGILEKPEIIRYFDGWGGIEYATNNRVEILAVLHALQSVIYLGLEHVEIRTDSQYVIDGVKRILNGRMSMGSPNIDTWKQLLVVLMRYDALNIRIDWTWVEGHSDNYGNDMADLNAAKGRTLYTKGFQYSHRTAIPAKRYHKPPTPNYTRLLTHSRWYFFTQMQEMIKSNDGRTIYLCGNHGKDDESWGRRFCDTCHSIVLLEKPEPVLESIRQYQDIVGGSHYRFPAIGRLDNIFKGKVFDHLDKDGSIYVKPIKNNSHSLQTMEGVPLTKVMSPPKLAWHAIDVLDKHLKLLEAYLIYEQSPNGGNPHGFYTTDITQAIYQSQTTKTGKLVYKVSPALLVNTRQVEIDGIDYVNATDDTHRPSVRLVIGDDIPSRNALSALAKTIPTIKVLTWKDGDDVIRYGTLVQSNGDIGFYTCAFSNVILLDQQASDAA